ncbi:LysR substrate-binding domain-containing protein [Photobacterium sagamiensis]|uniref:LysR family transcriptional regulator n=1 Tax=Photobacterium sagamiensis TaxID=2910241 RepID=UPI003D0C73BE
MLNKVNLADIRSFVLIAQQGNFTKAAEVLSVSRSHVSRQISALEKQMGVTLLIRTTRTLRLTEAGKLFYQQCETALGQIDQALITAVDDTEEVRGKIRLNCVGGYLGEEVVSPMVCEFMNCHPEIEIHLEFSSHRIDLIDDEFDLALRMGKIDDAGFVAKRLLNLEMATLASPAYLKCHGGLEHPKDLIDHRCITGSVKKWHFQKKNNTSQSYNVQVDGQLECKNGRVLLKGALMGNGIIRVPLIYCQQEVQRGELQRVLNEWNIPNVEFSAIYHRDRYQPKRLRVFIEFMKDYFEQIGKNK